MTVFAVWIVNKAGGLVYNRTFARPSLCPPPLELPSFRRWRADPPLEPCSYTAGLPQISQNDALVLAGTLHGVHAITAQLSPVGSDGRAEGCEIVESDWGRVVIYLTPTGFVPSLLPILQRTGS